jgi:hypothetical protein
MYPGKTRAEASFLSNGFCFFAYLTASQDRATWRCNRIANILSIYRALNVSDGALWLVVKLVMTLVVYYGDKIRRIAR